MSLDLSPAPGAAPAGRRLRRHAITEATLLLRNGEQLLLALVIPLAILVAGWLAGPRIGIGLDLLAPSVLALAVWSTGFTSCAIATGFDRRYRVLERLAASPLGRSGLIIGKSLAVGAVVLGQCALLGVAALCLGWRPVWSTAAFATAAIALLLACVAFVAAALLLAGTLRAEVVLALANVIYMAGLAFGILPIGTPGWLAFTGWLPTGALGGVFRAASLGYADLTGAAVLAGWALILVLITRKAFRWTS